MSFLSHAQAAPSRIYRSKLLVPASETRFFEKAAASAADAICLDLEDGVSAAKKDTARANAVTALNQIDWRGKMMSCRINGLDTHWCYRDVIALAEDAGEALDALLIPKVGNVSDLYAIDMLATQAGTAAVRPKPILLEAMIETAAGLGAVEAIAGGSPRLASLHFGHADFSISMGMRTIRIGSDSDDYVALSSPGAGQRRADLNDPWHYPLVRTIAAARARGLLPIEGAYGDFRDVEGLEVYCRRAAYLGCVGKWAIHPDQIEPINRIFSPSVDQIAQAHAVLDAMRVAQSEGRGAVAVDGVLVDMVTIRQAEQLLKLAESIASDQPSSP